MTEVYVTGASMTPFGRFLEKSVKDLTREAVSEALADADLEVSDVEAAWFSNTTQGVLEGQTLVPGQMALRDMGFEGIPMANVENACASASTAFNMAYTAIRAGQCDIALAVGADKMYHADKARSFEIFDGAIDVHDREATFARLNALGDGVETPPEAVLPNGQRSPFMDIYANWAKFHMKNFGTTQKHLAHVASKNHFHSTLNPKSQYRDDISVEQVMGARLVSWPLTLPMCSPISDGAAAAILVSERMARKLGMGRAVRVAAAVMGTSVNREPDDLENHVTRRASKKAYEFAGFGPEDIHVAEVHDATAMGEIQQVENMGLCAFGEAGPAAERGETRLGGRVPVNPSGGLESKGHPIGATGLGQIYELVTQVRGEAGARQVEGARRAIAENGGGVYRFEEATCAITVLEGPAAA
ncbi:thiolase family protein [Minwuia sp.]|uniref:thiolase family protein n=1 Tax=Minwuia sp. TaxID=2493630 RepID=UPI003A92984C